MNVIVLTEPSVEPVDLQMVYDHLRLTPSNDSPPTHPHDAMLSRHIASARADAEQLTHRSFVQQRLLMTTNRFPPCRGYIELLRPPVQEVLSVSYYDTDNALRLVDPDAYFATDDLVTRLIFTSAFVAPCVYAAADSIRIEYIAGYEHSDDSPPDYVENVPSQIKEAILLGVTLLYEPLEPREREAIEKARDSLLSGFVVHSLA